MLATAIGLVYLWKIWLSDAVSGLVDRDTSCGITDNHSLLSVTGLASLTRGNKVVVVVAAAVDVSAGPSNVHDKTFCVDVAPPVPPVKPT
jgi:hypothetical protein